MSLTAPTAAPPPSGWPSGNNLAPHDVEALANELVAYHALFAPLFRREEQRQWALKYLQGQLLDLERKSVEPMAPPPDGRRRSTNRLGISGRPIPATTCIRSG